MLWCLPAVCSSSSAKSESWKSRQMQAFEGLFLLPPPPPQMYLAAPILNFSSERRDHQRPLVDGVGLTPNQRKGSLDLSLSVSVLRAGDLFTGTTGTTGTTYWTGRKTTSPAKKPPLLSRSRPPASISNLLPTWSSLNHTLPTHITSPTFPPPLIRSPSSFRSHSHRSRRLPRPSSTTVTSPRAPPRTATVLPLQPPEPIHGAMKFLHGLLHLAVNTTFCATYA